MLVMFPLTFLSNAFVPAESLPGWLQTFVRINPVSHLVSAVRSIAGNGQFDINVVWALVGAAAVVAIFAPLAVKAYMRKA